jgi:GTP-binding protein HflX
LKGPERALLVAVASGPRGRGAAEDSLAELAHLAASAGAAVVGSVLQERRRLDPATLLGRGKVGEVAALRTETAADLVLFDEELSPAQQRNLEVALGCKTLDRTQLILDVFARRARTREGRLQVELAQLGYLLPRLGGKGIELSRLGGGIGTRGPGETKLETDRRRIRQRIAVLRRQIEGVRAERRVQRSSRARRETPVVALVGYTNAGKSTLFNALTRASAGVSAQLFMTLDPLTRRLALGAGREILVSDTVGFIQKLPHGLVAAFRATLEEVVEADLLLHVMDAAAEDVDARAAAVTSVLDQIGASERPRLVVLNKSDCLSAARARALVEAHPGGLLVSARTGEGVPALRGELAGRLGLATRRVRLSFRRDEERAIAGVYSAGRVTSHEVAGDEVEIAAELPERLLDRYRGHLRG